MKTIWATGWVVVTFGTDDTLRVRILTPFTLFLLLLPLVFRILIYITYTYPNTKINAVLRFRAY